MCVLLVVFKGNNSLLSNSVYVWFVCVCVQEREREGSLNEVIGVVGIGLKSLGFLLHAFLDFQDGGRLRLILQGTKNKPEWLFYITICPLRNEKKTEKNLDFYDWCDVTVMDNQNGYYPQKSASFPIE